MSKKSGQNRVRQQPKKRTQMPAKRRKRGINFRADTWYASAASSIAIASTGRGERVSSQWVSQLQADPE